MLTAYFFAYGRVDAILLGCDGRWAYVDSGYVILMDTRYWRCSARV